MAANTVDASTLPDLVITRVFDAPRDLVWRAWTDPAHLARWWGPHEFTTDVERLEVTPGGRFRYVMRGPGGMQHLADGVFDEVIAPERLVVTSWLPDAEGNKLFEARNIVTFEPRGARTELTLRVHVTLATPQMAGAVAGMEMGWNQSLDRLAGDVATKASDREIVVTRVVDAPRDVVSTAWSDVAATERVDYTGRDGGAGKDETAFESTVTFEEEGGRTRVTLRSRFQSAAARDFVLREHGAFEGAQQTLNRLARQLMQSPHCQPGDTHRQPVDGTPAIPEKRV